jgi:pyruvate carboxylase subunit B
MRYHVSVGGRTVVIDVEGEHVVVDGRSALANIQRVGGTELVSLLLGGESHPMVIRRGGSGVWEVDVHGRHLSAEVVDERTRHIRDMTGAASKPSGPRPLRAPMPGLVVKVEVAEGEEVLARQGLVIVEAMKMENELRAEVAGRVSRVRVEPGQAVEKDQVLVEFYAPEGGA